MEVLAVSLKTGPDSLDYNVLEQSESIDTYFVSRARRLYLPYRVDGLYYYLSNSACPEIVMRGCDTLNRMPGIVGADLWLGGGPRGRTGHLSTTVWRDSHGAILDVQRKALAILLNFTRQYGIEFSQRG